MKKGTVTQDTYIKVPTMSHRSYNVRLFAGVILTNLFVVGLACYFIINRWVDEDIKAKATTSNLSYVLSQNISGTIDKIDLILISVSDEIEKQLANNKIENLSLESIISLERERLPVLNRILITNAKGEIVFGGDGSIKPRKSVANRDYFMRLRDDPKLKFVIGKPIAGVVDGKWIQIFARRINNPDSSFAGVVTGSINLEYFLKLFSTVNVGENGSITLRDSDLAIVARYPILWRGGSTVGQKTVSKDFRELIETGKNNATYKATYPIDNLERIYTFNKLPNYPLYMPLPQNLWVEGR